MSSAKTKVALRSHFPGWMPRVAAASWMPRCAASQVLCATVLSALLLGCASAATGQTIGLPAGITNDLALFQIKPGFRIELVAAEPMVESPVALAFDERGRLFVAEMRDYPDRRGEHPLVGRIRMLEDTNGSGTYNSSTIYADDLAWPSALACYGGGVFVAVTPDIIYLKDSRTNGVADVNQVVFSGFGSGTNASDARGALNNFQWGLDNRIHVGTAGLGGIVTSWSAPGAPALSLSGADFCFDPRTHAIFTESGAARSGLAFDNGGRRFVCDFSRPLRSPMYELRYFARNPFFPRPPEMIDVANPATQIYHFMAAPPPKARGAGGVSSVSAAGTARGQNTLAEGWLAAAHGAVIYRGNAFPPAYLENAFIADPQAHIIHRAVLRENGLEVIAERAPDESNMEFLVSRDPAFHPMQIVNGPDGALYIADQRSDNGGRIYRIVPATYRAGRLPSLSRAKTYDLVAALASPNGWRRDTAARLLYERQDRSAVPLLSDMLNRSRLPLARLQALHALAGLGALKEEHVNAACASEDERLREHAVLLAEKLVTNGAVSDTIWEQLQSMTADPAVRVRYQLAFTLGEIQRSETGRVLAELLQQDLENPWIRAAVQSSVGTGAADLFVQLASDARFRANPAGLDLLRQLAGMIGVTGQKAPVSQVVDFIARTPLEAEPSFSMIYALGDGLFRTGSSLGLVDPELRLQRFYAQASFALINNTLQYPRDAEVLRLLSVSPYKMSDGRDWLIALPGTTQPEAMQGAAIAGLRYSNDPRLGTNLLADWPVLSPALRTRAVSTLLARSDRVGLVVAALENGRIRTSEVSPTDANFLRTYSDGALSERARRLLGPLRRQHPETEAQFAAALALTGDATHGREVFQMHCSACHRLGGEGHATGFDLAGVKIHGRKALLDSILAPSAEVAPGQEASVLQTKTGELAVGIASDANLTTVTMRQAQGDRAVWPRDNIESLQPQTWSLMPDGLEEGLAAQDMADLLEYVLTTGP